MTGRQHVARSTCWRPKPLRSDVVPSPPRSRLRPAAQTVALLEPLRRAAGITRLANITGLDRVGIPVWLAIRPNSRSLAVASGKGVTHDDARCSALCESLENHLAECHDGPVRLARFHDFNRAQVIDPEKLPRARTGHFRRDDVLPWVEAQDLRTRESLWVPHELVHADARVPRPPGSGAFLFSSNGLASGNDDTEAVLHALCELVERDAMVLWKRRSDRWRRGSRLDLDSITGAANRWLLSRFEAADIDVVVWNTTSDIGVAVFCVLLIDRASASALTPFPAAYGAGCHPNREIAMVRALTEAAQSRVTSIAGTRDDMTRRSYESTQSADRLATYAQLAREAARGRFEAAPNWPELSPDASVTLMLDRLAARDLPRALAVRISPAHGPLHVVRLIVPGLEGPSSSASYVPGVRARATRR